MSLAAILVMTVTLFVIGGVVFLSATLNASLDTIKNKVDVNVYFQTWAPETDILAVAQSLRALPEVKQVDYVSREQALANFKERHRADALTLQALNELPDNPLGAALNIRAAEPSAYEGIAQFLKRDTALSKDNKQIIDEVNYYDNKTAIDTLTRIIDSAQTLGFALSLVLIFVSIVIALNTIRLVIYSSREEIGVMRLVGASNAYIRGPFVITGIFYGIASSILTLIVYYPLTYYAGGATENFFSGLNVFRYYLEHLGKFFGLIAGTGVALGAVSSYWAVRRYLTI